MMKLCFVILSHCQIVHRNAKEMQQLHLPIQLFNGKKDFVQIKSILYNDILSTCPES